MPPKHDEISTISKPFRKIARIEFSPFQDGRKILFFPPYHDMLCKSKRFQQDIGGGMLNLQANSLSLNE